MPKAREISAVAISLADGVEAVFVKHGAEWNGLCEYRCIAPGAFVGQVIVTGPDPDAEAPIWQVFDSIFGRVHQAPIIMATASIAAAIKAVDSATAKGG